mgnify:CR=1 FL=1
MNIFGRIRDRISGTEKIFVVRNVERGVYSLRNVGGIKSYKFSDYPDTFYSREIVVRKINVQLDVDEANYQVHIMQALEPVSMAERFDGIRKGELEILVRLEGKPMESKL